MPTTHLERMILLSQKDHDAQMVIQHLDPRTDEYATFESLIRLGEDAGHTAQDIMIERVRITHGDRVRVWEQAHPKSHALWMNRTQDALTHLQERGMVHMFLRELRPPLYWAGGPAWVKEM